MYSLTWIDARRQHTIIGDKQAIMAVYDALRAVPNLPHLRPSHFLAVHLPSGAEMKPDSNLTELAKPESERLTVVEYGRKR